MKRIAVLVEGPSDKLFWDRVLHKHCRGVRFKISSLNGRTKLLASARNLCDAFKGLKYDALFILLDADEQSCVSAVRQSLDQSLQQEIQCTRESRWTHLAVAFRELESWYLADPEALIQAFDVEPNQINAQSASTGGKAALARILRQRGERSIGYFDREIATKISRFFDPERAWKNSASFRYFWTCLEAIMQR